MLRRILFGLFMLGFVLVPVRAQFDSGSTGADGPFNPPSQVPAGTQVRGDCTRYPGCNVIVPLPPNGIFNFTTVNIPNNNITVSFRPNQFNTPVTILAQGDVTIAGTLSVNGSPGFRGSEGGAGGLGGPGGFRGGDGGRFDANLFGGAGLGPGGGAPGTRLAGCSSQGPEAPGEGSFGTVGRGNSRPTYGLPSLLPLVGGSGGAGGNCPSDRCTAGSRPAGGGGGGGGAILLASSTTINITSDGHITAAGGYGAYGDGACSGASGSAGAIRLVANAITINGYVEANIGGGYGRIRLESGAPVSTSRVQFYPSIFIFMPFAPPSVGLPSLPSLQITTLDGVTVPYPPHGQFGTPDVILTRTGQKPVGLAASGIPLGTTVEVTAKRDIGSPSVVTVTSTPLSGTVESSTATATVELPTLGSYYLEARATFSVPAGGAQESMKIDGEKVKKMRIETAEGAGSRVVYILESGKEVSADRAIFARNTALPRRQATK